MWQFIANFILEPTAMQCFNHTLERLKTDPRITVRLGSTSEIRGALMRVGPVRETRTQGGADDGTLHKLAPGQYQRDQRCAVRGIAYLQSRNTTCTSSSVQSTALRRISA